ncbi:tryptophan--tRNA ligase [Jonquetella sp. BV3C21]|uniref:tryptophan--tRNA ligase n=1 Tax=Jonquetella sp. BV3C21 TaxID=1111126 RepID=UPI0003AD93DA|nr:tryptophan--tRNA ligase [Jonquetella sp. BV3C21]ERL24890.1 tryptophan--tRNA ligase [Jonquetella sp. BV3C21]
MKRIFSGMRPTGKLHLGHMAGALTNWLKLQRDPNVECFFGIVDWHAMTSNYADMTSLKVNCEEVLLDWLAVGLDPEKSPIFLQSHVHQHVELALALGMLTPLGWLERCPTYKEQILNLSNKDLGTYGFLGYPVLMAADILIYKATDVPVGEDQTAHLELARAIANRFNNFYRPVFPEPQIMLTATPKVPGTDGRKMSKSYGNSLMISDRADALWEKIRTMVTDPARIRKTDPGDPNKCPVWDLHKVFNGDEASKCQLAADCRAGAIGCIQCKRVLSDRLNEMMTPIWDRRDRFSSQPGLMEDILADGAARASAVAECTMAEAREAIGFIHPYRK